MKCGKLDSFDDAEASAEGATLANWTYNKFKAEKEPLPSVVPFGKFDIYKPNDFKPLV